MAFVRTDFPEVGGLSLTVRKAIPAGQIGTVLGEPVLAPGPRIPLPPLPGSCLGNPGLLLPLPASCKDGWGWGTSPSKEEVDWLPVCL